MEREEKLKKTAQLCGKENYDEKDEFAVNYAERIIKNYCNIKEIGEELTETLLDMAAEIEKIGGYGEENSGGEIKQIKEGDVTISFCDGRESRLSIKNYENQLNLFRKPRW